MNTFFRIKCTEVILSNSTRELLRFEITKMLIAVLTNKVVVSFRIILDTLSFGTATAAVDEHLFKKQRFSTALGEVVRGRRALDARSHDDCIVLHCLSRSAQVGSAPRCLPANRPNSKFLTTQRRRQQNTQHIHGTSTQSLQSRSALVIIIVTLGPAYIITNL